MEREKEEEILSMPTANPVKKLIPLSARNKSHASLIFAAHYEHYFFIRPDVATRHGPEKFRSARRDR